MPDKPKPNEEVRPQSATVRPKPVRAKVTIPTPTILVTDTQVMDETGLEVVIKAEVTATDRLGVTDHVEAVITPTVTETVFKLVVRDSGPGEMLEVEFHTEDGRVIFHDMDHTDWTPHWASVELAEKIGEAFVREIEGL